jgi:hypothetical protein
MNSLQFLWGALLFTILVLAIAFVRQYYLAGWIERIPIVRSLDDSYERAKKALLLKPAVKDDKIVLQSTWDRENMITKFKQAGFSKKRLEAAIRVLDYIETYKALALQDMLDHQVLASVKLAQALLESDIGRSKLAREGNNHFGIKGIPTSQGRKKIARIRAGHDEYLCYCAQQTDFTYKPPAISTINANDDHFTDAFEVYESAADSYRRHTRLLTSCHTYGRKGCYGWIWGAFPVGATVDITQIAIDHRHITGMAPADYFGGQVEVPYYAGAASALKAAFYATSKAYPKKIRSLIETYELWRFDYDAAYLQ